MLTDYPDADLISNLTHNIATCAPVFPSPFARAASPAVATGHLWGTPAAPLLAHLADAEPEGEVAPAPPQPRGFDLVLLADLVFNHSEHGALVGTVAATLRRGRGARALVFFTPHRPWLLQRDLAFLERCRGMGWGVWRVGVWVGVWVGVGVRVGVGAIDIVVSIKSICWSSNPAHGVKTGVLKIIQAVLISAGITGNAAWTTMFQEVAVCQGLQCSMPLQW